jgi:hypothetical protein
MVGQMNLQNGLLFKKSRVIIPESMKKYFLQMSHVGHIGVQQALRGRGAKDAMVQHDQGY